MEINRNDLYNQVWSKPMVRLAQEYGISDVGLAKLCRRLSVPRPPRGYWAKLQAGKKARKIPLPALKQRMPSSLFIEPDKHRPAPMAEPRSDQADPPTRLPEVSLPQDLRGCHELVTATRRALEANKLPYQGIVYATGAGCLDVRVGKSSIHRALILCEALIRACESQGWRVESSEKSAKTVIVIGDDPVNVLLKEKTNRIELESDSERRFVWRTFDYSPSGQLCFEVVNRAYNSRLRGRWSDGKRQRLEDILPKLIASLPIYSNAIKDARIESEARERRWEEERRRREELARRVEAEKKKRGQLTVMARAWRDSEELHAFCDAVESTLTADIQDATNAKDWLKWAREISNLADPLKNGTLPSELRKGGGDSSLDCSGNTWF